MSLRYYDRFRRDGGRPQAAPDAPTALAATRGVKGEIVLSWTPPASVDSYKILRGTSSGSEIEVHSGVAAGASTYTDTGLADDTRYYYKIKATLAGVDSSSSSEVDAWTWLLYDSYTQADGPAGAADTGQSWVAAGCSGGGTVAQSVSGNEAYLSGVCGDNQSFMLVNTVADVTAKLALKAIASGVVVRNVIRAADQNNLIMAQIAQGSGVSLFKRVATTFTQLGATYAVAPAVNDVSGLAGSGSALTVTVNGVTAVTATDSAGSTNTYVGWGHGSSAGTSNRIDNYGAHR